MKLKPLFTLVVVLFTTLAFTQKSSAQITVSVHFDATSLDQGAIIIQDLVLNTTTTQSGVTQSLSWPYYGWDLAQPTDAEVAVLTSNTTPTGPLNGFTVTIESSSYVTVYNQSNSTKKGNITIQFDGPETSLPITVNIPPHSIATVPFPTNGNKKSYNSAQGGFIYIWYNDTIHQ